MCNLYDIGPSRLKPRNAFEAAALGLFPELPQEKSIRKTDPGLVVITEGDHYTGEIMRWGFQRDFNKAINNTRSDKLGTTMWREALADRRCLIPVAAFYEWTGAASAKQAHRISSPEPGDWLWVAGIYEHHRELGFCFSMITSEAPAWMERIHHRMIAVFDNLESAESYLHTDDPGTLIVPPQRPLSIVPCASPLKKPPPPGSTVQPTLL